jgi:hypothetical protein
VAALTGARGRFRKDGPAELVFGVALELVGVGEEQIEGHADEGVVRDALVLLRSAGEDAAAECGQGDGLVVADAGFGPYEGEVAREAGLWSRHAR